MYQFSSILVLAGTAMYYAAPGLIANMAPVFAMRLNFLNIQIDFGRKWKGKRIFGSHKTYRGFFFGILTAILLVFLQTLLYHNGFFRGISFVDYSKISLGTVIYLGFLLGFGALFGDLVKSFIKRRVGILPGKSFYPWDQLDYILGILALVWLFKAPTLAMALLLLVLAPAAHVGACAMGYYLGLKKEIV
jgi:CDP-2,3-bis-(O-geranylgeranyl)-sn-glycerol synthase